MCIRDRRRLADSDAAWKPEMERMDRREHLYSGDRELRALTKGDEGQKAPHIRNIVFENIESQVSSAIPSPKVTPRRKEDEGLADKIEHWLRCELDRLPFETINDQAERTVPIPVSYTHLARGMRHPYGSKAPDGCPISTGGNGAKRTLRGRRPPGRTGKTE